MNMRKKQFASLTMFCLIVSIAVSTASAQRKRQSVKPKAKPSPIIFAVTNDGKTIEPLGTIDKGSLEPAAGGDSEPKVLNAFVRQFYQPKTVYRLVFGGADAGTVTVNSSNEKKECSKNMAQVTTVSAKAKLKGFVMALATSEPISKTASGLRRLPTAAERAEAETLVRAEFAKQNIAAGVLKNLKYHNLTALDVDNDKKPELVGSFWVETAPTERALLFFIADKTASGKYAMGISEYQAVKQADVMSEDITSVDGGVYHEMLLDALEYNGDTTAEIFTYIQSFEGGSFNAYSRQDGKWSRVFEGSNYHCAF